MRNQRGSFLIVCLSLMILMTILAFAALQDIRLQVDASTGNQRYLLAEAAAKSGLNHAMEQILTDYNQSTMTLNGSAAPLPAITFLDGQYRAPFTAIYSPNTTSYGGDNNTATCDNDTRAEDYVMRPWAWWWDEVGGWWGYGLMMYDGKGRYYEPGYYNASPTATGTPYPVNPTLFTDPNAPVPERSQGMFYDDQFCRITSNPNAINPQQDRQAARYRLRYTVGVEDLSGHLLINPIPEMQMLTSTDPAAPPVDYRNPSLRYPWMQAATNALGDIVGGANSGMFGAQLEHVFQGRGYHTNVDFDHSASGITGWPKTFPLSYRNHAINGGSGNWGSFIEGYGDSSLTTNLFYFATGTPSGLAAGGEVIPNWAWNDGTNNWPYNSQVINHCLVGPQLSFDNTVYAAHGEKAYLGTQDGGGVDGAAWDKYAVTPFGRGLTTTGFNPSGKNKWYQGRVDTPFYQNLMTTPPAIISAMLLAYLPPREKIFKYTSISWVKCTGVDGNGNRQYQQLYDANGNAWLPIDGTNPQNESSSYGRDLLVDTTIPPAFSQWPAPDRSDSNPPGAQNPPGATGIGQHIKPDYYAVDVRNPLTTYPGPFMNGDASLTGQAGDDLGLQMNELQLGNGLEFYDQQPYVNLQAGYPSHYLHDFGDPPAVALPLALNWTTTNPPPGSAGPPSTNWGDNDYDYVTKAPDPHQVLHAYSYYFDMLDAMAAALTVFRAEYIQYNLPWIAANNIFTAGDPNPTTFQTLRDLDKLFLAEMGESIDFPGTGTPQQLMANGQIKTYGWNASQPLISANKFIPQNNIKSLVALTGATSLQNADGSVSSVQRGHIMELLLNDFRMSFLGSSPGYSDAIDPVTNLPNPNLEFRPLDFDGDGVVYCSCYGTMDKDHLPCAPAGTKPETYFSITGNFFIGKSHFFRVISRGEVWDNLLNVKINDATLDSVLSVDPDGTDPTQTQPLYQRWFYNRYLAMFPHVQR